MSTDATGTDGTPETHTPEHDDTPEIDTSEMETPAVAGREHPTVPDAAMTWALLGGVAVVANVIVLAIALGAGADMQAGLGSGGFEITWVVVLLATAAWLLFAVFGWALVAHRVPAFAHLWVPLQWGMAVVAVAGLVAVTGVATGITLGVMTVIATLLAAHAVPRRLPR